MADSPVSQLSFYLVTFAGDEPGAQETPLGDFSEELTPDPPPPDPPDPASPQFLVLPPNKAAAEFIVLKSDTSDAPDVLPAAIHRGYVTHGMGYFEAVQKAINSPLANAQQGSQQPELKLTGQQIGLLSGIVGKAIAEETKRILDAVAAVQTWTATWSMERLEASQKQVRNETVRYLQQIRNEDQASSWLSTADSSAGARTFLFSDEVVDLVRSILALQPFYRALQQKDADLAAATKDAGPEMQGIAGSRWLYLRKRDPKNTPRASATRSSKDYGVELMDASNAARPDLVAKATELFPDPVTVAATRQEVLRASAALTATLVEEGADHPVLYRIWSPSLAQVLRNRIKQTVIERTDASFYSPVSDLRLAVSAALRSAYAAAGSLHDTIKADASHTWKFPLLIRAGLDAMGLAEDDFRRIVAEHTVEGIAEEAERRQIALLRISEVLAASQLAIRYIPAPEVTLPVTLILEVISQVVGGIGLLYEYFAESDSRDAFRAFLRPSDSFAVSDGSYLGVVIGAAVTLFALAGLQRTTITVPAKHEVGIAAGAIAFQEYSTIGGGARR